MILDALNVKHPLRDTGYSNSDDAATLPRHRWYLVKEAFSPYMVERAIEDSQFNEGDIIVDPFCGSGTVLLTSALKKRRAIGFEVNPFLAFVSQTKLHEIKPNILARHLNSVVAYARQGKPSPLEGFSSFGETSGEDKWLFNQEVLMAFEGGWRATAGIYRPARDILRLGLVGAAMDTCNATKDGKCLRYRKNWRDLGFGRIDFLNALENRVKDFQTDLFEIKDLGGECIVHLGDSRKIIRNELKEKFKLCITSPPYLNSFDYTDIYRPELFLGKFVCSKEELRSLRFRTVRSHTQAKWERPKENAFGSLYQDAVNKITANAESLWNKDIPLMIQAYFEDIERVLRDLRRLAKPDASVWLVVSTSAYVGVEVPVDLIIAHIGTKVGWYLREVGVLRYLRSSGQHLKRYHAGASQKPRLRESVIILDASTTRKCKYDPMSVLHTSLPPPSTDSV